MTAEEISNIIIANLAERQFPIYMTKFFGGGMPEADVLGINKSGYMYEYEIKRTRSDFAAEFKYKRYKHFNLAHKDGVRTYSEFRHGKATGKKKTVITLANRFYFACEPGLISTGEVPEYAGLVYVSESGVEEIRIAPLLHREKANDYVYARVATMLSERVMWGMAYRTWVSKGFCSPVDTTHN